jgi:hypothetical protein
MMVCHCVISQDHVSPHSTFNDPVSKNVGYILFVNGSNSFYIFRNVQLRLHSTQGKYFMRVYIVLFTYVLYDSFSQAIIGNPDHIWYSVSLPGFSKPTFN